MSMLNVIADFSESLKRGYQQQVQPRTQREAPKGEGAVRLLFRRNGAYPVPVIISRSRNSRENKKDDVTLKITHLP